MTPLHPVSRYCTALKAVRSSASYAGPPSHPDTKVRCAVMMIRPCKPRDSAPPALLEFVNSIGPCLVLRDYTLLHSLFSCDEPQRRCFWAPLQKRNRLCTRLRLQLTRLLCGYWLEFQLTK